MCGIAGFATRAYQAGRLEPGLQAALRRLSHRGPDHEASVLLPTPPAEGGPGAGLGYRRLAIVDLSPSGHQPMTSADGRWTLVYNGELYNHRELRTELERAGCRFRSHSDTEVLLEAYAAWGPAALDRMTGMFAFALHDRREGRLLLVRDPFGIKPLYYGYDGETLVFASEIPALLEFPGLARTVDPAHYKVYLHTGNTDFGDGTLFRDLRRVPAGCRLEIPLANPRAAQAVRYWTLDLERDAGASFGEAVERVREGFLDSVRLHLRSDVPLGFALSGGIDSSAVVMAARWVLGRGSELHTFSYVPDDPRIDEERHVDAVVAGAGAVAHKLQLAPAELERDIETLAAVQGEPFASPVIYAQYRVLGLARAAGVKVVLGGQGADEILAGYDRYLPARMASLLRQGHWLRAAGMLRAPVTPYREGRSAAIRAAVAYALTTRQARLARRVWRLGRSAPPWLEPRWFTDRGVRPAPPWNARGRHVLREMLGHNLATSQVEGLLRFEDRSAMSFSLENRVPFLTQPLVQLLFSLPEDYLLAEDGTRKAVFRAAMRGIVPDQVLDRRDKIGFSVPMQAWFEALRPWVGARLQDASRLPGLRRPVLEREWRALVSNGRAADPYLVWRCVSLSHWVERFGARFE